MQRELLYSPIRDLTHEDFVFTPAVDFMDRAEFLQQLPCSAKFAQDSSVEGHLIDLPVVHRCAGVGVRRCAAAGGDAAPVRGALVPGGMGRGAGSGCG